MAEIWKLWGTLFFPLAIATHFATRTPADKPVGKPFNGRVPSQSKEPPKRYTICGIAPCWEVVGTPIR